MIPFPDKKYNIIYADPPWSYRDKAVSGNRGASFKYPTQSKEWIQNLPVSDIADNDCSLFMWATAPQMPVAFDVIKSWGFEYKTVAFTWVKTNKKSNETLFFGMGNWTRANSEFCLLATKGKPKRINASVHSVIISPIARHSEKPNETRKRIIRLMGDLPRIELFAREQREGFDVWGNEV